MLIIDESEKYLKSLDSEIFDLVITSPPYKDEDGYTKELIENVFTQVYRVQKSETLLFLNFGHLANFKSRPFHVVNILENIGYKLNDTITWVKNHYSPIQGKKRVNNLTEFIFVFYKDNMSNLDRLSIGIPYADKSNIGRYADKDLKCAGNVWYLKYETIQDKKMKLHNDRFPLDLPKNAIKLSGLKEGIILDPFGGSGTTGVAAKQLGLDFLLIEKNNKYKEIIEDRLKNASRISIP